MKVNCCKKICNTCGFTKNGTNNTLYAEAIDIIKQGVIFPCHEYLQSKTGSENTGTETLKEIKVCRGYVAYMKINRPELSLFTPIWDKLFNEIRVDELEEIYSKSELIQNHNGLRNKIYLRN